MRTIDKGQIAVIRVELRAAELGFTPCRPTIEGTRFDLILEKDGKCQRIQVKYCDVLTSNCESGSYTVNLRKVQNNGRQEVKLYEKGEIDALIVYLPSTAKLYWFEESEFVGKQTLTIRTEIPKNNQAKKCRMAEKYEW